MLLASRLQLSTTDIIADLMKEKPLAILHDCILLQSDSSCCAIWAKFHSC